MGDEPVNVAIVTSLSLSYFRSYLSARLEPGPGLIAIHGRNGTGKTNILEAISLLSPGRGIRRAPAAELMRRPEALGWKVAARLQASDAAHDVETWAQGDSARQIRVDGKAAPQVALGRIVRILWLVPTMDRLWSEGPEGRRRFLDRMTLSFSPAHGGEVLTFERAMRERNRLLRDDVRDARWFDVLEARMAEAAAAIITGRRAALAELTAAQTGAHTAFPVAELEYDAEGPDTAGEWSAMWAHDRERDRTAGRTVSGPHRADLGAVYAEKGMPARECSTGEQKALLVSLILANARALSQSTGTPPILLLDEVAAHLDPDRRAALFEELAASGAQAWMTGSERGLFDGLPGDATYLAVSDEGGASHIHRR